MSTEPAAAQALLIAAQERLVTELTYMTVIGATAVQVGFGVSRHLVLVVSKNTLVESFTKLGQWLSCADESTHVGPQPRKPMRFAQRPRTKGR